MLLDAGLGQWPQGPKRANQVDFVTAAMVNENLVIGSIRSSVQSIGQIRDFIASRFHQTSLRGELVSRF